MATPSLTDKAGTNTGRPWSLHGREADIAELRDLKQLTFEQIAVLMRASKQGVIGAYKRHAAMKKGPIPSTDMAPDQIESCDSPAIPSVSDSQAPDHQN